MLDLLPLDIKYLILEYLPGWYDKRSFEIACRMRDPDTLPTKETNDILRLIECNDDCHTLSIDRLNAKIAANNKVYCPKFRQRYYITSLVWSEEMHNQVPKYIWDQLTSVYFKIHDDYFPWNFLNGRKLERLVVDSVEDIHPYRMDLDCEKLKVTFDTRLPALIEKGLFSSLVRLEIDQVVKPKELARGLVLLQNLRELTLRKFDWYNSTGCVLPTFTQLLLKKKRVSQLTYLEDHNIDVRDDRWHLFPNLTTLKCAADYLRKPLPIHKQITSFSAIIQIEESFSHVDLVYWKYICLFENLVRLEMPETLARSLFFCADPKQYRKSYSLPTLREFVIYHDGEVHVEYGIDNHFGEFADEDDTHPIECAHFPQVKTLRFICDYMLFHLSYYFKPFDNLEHVEYYCKEEPITDSYDDDMDDNLYRLEGFFSAIRLDTRAKTFLFHYDNPVTNNSTVLDSFHQEFPKAVPILESHNFWKFYLVR